MRISHIVGRCWNWKTALLSASARSLVFFAVNVSVGIGPGFRSMGTEMLFRLVASGLLGNLTERCARAPLAGSQTVAAIAVIAAAGHAGELAVHWLAGTPRLAASLAASVTFTLLSTAFNLFIMRRGALVAGRDSRPLVDDLRRLPRLILEFVQSPWSSRHCI